MEDENIWPNNIQLIEFAWEESHASTTKFQDRASIFGPKS